MDESTLEDVVVHVAGPVETEPADVGLGFVYVQRCLVCDCDLRRWPPSQLPPTVTIALGATVAFEGDGLAVRSIVRGDLGEAGLRCEPDD